MAKQNVVIVGGGFGGIKAALTLTEKEHFNVTLVSDRDDFRYYPSLYRTATGGRRYISSVALTEIFKDKGIHIIKNAALKIDRSKKTIHLKRDGNIAYDTLILALGVQTNYFGIKGLKEFSYGIKSVEDAEELKHHLHQQIIDNNRLDLNYVIIGGGPTGVELAGVLPTYLRTIAKNHGLRRPAVRVSLVEAAPRLVPRMPKDISRSIAKHLRRLKVRLYLDTLVLSENAETLTLENKKLSSKTVIWTAGVTNHPFFAENSFQLTKNGKVRVDQYLQAEKDIYVIGDNADTPFSGMAQTALNDGRYVAKNLIDIAAKNDPEPYHAKKPVYVLPAGPKWAAVLWGKARFYGRVGYGLRRAADWIGYHDFEPWHLATKRWMAEDDQEEQCMVCSKV